MKRLGILTFLALSLAVTPLYSAQTTTATTARPAITVEDEATDLASLGTGGVVYSSAILCPFCPTTSEEDDCLDLSYAGRPCSLPSANCSCKFCGGEFGCMPN